MPCRSPFSCVVLAGGVILYLIHSRPTSHPEPHKSSHTPPPADPIGEVASMEDAPQLMEHLIPFIGNWVKDKARSDDQDEHLAALGCHYLIRLALSAADQSHTIKIKRVEEGKGAASLEWVETTTTVSSNTQVMRLDGSPQVTIEFTLTISSSPVLFSGPRESDRWQYGPGVSLCHKKRTREESHDLCKWHHPNAHPLSGRWGCHVSCLQRNGPPERRPFGSEFIFQKN